MKNNKKHIVIFSHGFGVRYDDRGLLSGSVGIAEALQAKGIETVLFDYNDVDEVNNTLTVYPLSAQAEKLRAVIEETKKENPEAIIDLVAHSQGSIIAGLTSLQGIRKTIFLAPSLVPGFEGMVKAFRDRPGTEINFDGISKLARLDGTVTIVPKEFWVERSQVDPVKLYNACASHTELTIINAKQDAVIKKVDATILDASIAVYEFEGNHNFEGDARGPLIARILDILKG